MRKRHWVAVLLALLAGGAVPGGCGGGSSTETGAETATTVTTEGATAAGVYKACLEAIQGTPAEAIGEAGCRRARDGFAKCTERAANAAEGTARDAAVAACQQTAEAATSALEAGG
jgi:hypothetical protein